MMTFGLRVLAGLLLCVLMPLAAAQERMDDVLRDFREHGYSSVSGAITRLKNVEDVPDAHAPLARRAAYQRALFDLAQRGRRHQDVIKASTAALQKMADSEACTRCHFDLLLADYYALKSNDAAGEKGAALLQQAEAVTKKLGAAEPSVSSELLQELLAAQALHARLNGQMGHAIEYSVQGSVLAKRNGNDAAQLGLLADTIGLNADLGDIKRSIEVGNEVVQRAEAMGFQAILASAYLDLGHAYSRAGDRAKQRVALEKGLEFAGDDPDQVLSKIILLNNLSDYWIYQPNGYPKTLAYAQQALTLAQQEKAPDASIAPMANVGIAEAGLGRIDAGVAALNKSIELAKKYHNDVFTIGITQELVRILKQAGRYRDALDALQSIIALQEQQTQQERETAVLELQEKYATERKVEEIEKLAAQNKLKQAELETEAWKQRLWVAVAVVLGLGLLMLAQSIKRARQANKKLADVNATLALQSSTDALTGAFNRRHTQALLDSLQKQLGQPGSEGHVGLIILDLDLFKRINDSRGHAAGDAVLVETVKRLRSRLRQNDVVARWGGEEFVLVLPHTPAHALSVVAKNVLDAIGSVAIEFEGQAIPVSVSLGVIGFPAVAGQAWSAALGLADSALYLAKASGRNQAVCIVRIDAEPDCSEADLQQWQTEGRAELLVINGPVADTTQS